MIDTTKDAEWVSATVKLIPSMAIDPHSIIYFENSFGNNTSYFKEDPNSVIFITSQTVSTCPMTKCPPSLSENFKALSKFTACPFFQ